MSELGDLPVHPAPGDVYYDASTGISWRMVSFGHWVQQEAEA